MRFRVRFLTIVVVVGTAFATWTTLTLLAASMLPSHTEKPTPAPLPTEEDIFVNTTVVFTDPPRTNPPPTDPPTAATLSATMAPRHTDMRPEPHTTPLTHGPASVVRGSSSDGLERSIVDTLYPFRKKWFVKNDKSDDVNRTVFAASGCDMFTVPFNPDHDARCIAFLSDNENWEKLVPMGQQEDERTVKFKIHYRGVPHLHAIIKTPQKLFPTEPFGEIGAYHFDRMFLINRVPPTGMGCIPTAVLRNITRIQKADDLPLVDVFAKESHVTNYSQWLQKDVYDWGLTHNEKDCIHVSVQLFLAGVVRYLDSIYTIPYRPHNASWQRYYTPGIGFPSDHNELTRNLMRIGLLHMGTLVTMDYIAGNVDRSPNKNNFVAGGCQHPHRTDNCDHDEGDLQHTGYPSFVHLDQGMYFTSSARANPLHQDNSTFCIFSSTLHATLQTIAKRGRDVSTQALKDRMPTLVFQKLDQYSTALRHWDSRLRHVLKHIKKCVETYGLGIVLV